MQAVHELGHVLGAWVSGGHVRQVVLHPLTISRTDLADNPHPLFVVWAGPLFGDLLPVSLWLAAYNLRWPSAYLWRFFAGFCVIANGAYIAGGAWAGIGDCGEMLRHGAPIWLLWLFGSLTVPLGIWLWHRQGHDFGFGPSPRQITWRDAAAPLLAALALLLNALVVNKG